MINLPTYCVALENNSLLTSCRKRILKRHFLQPCQLWHPHVCFLSWLHARNQWRIQDFQKRDSTFIGWCQWKVIQIMRANGRSKWLLSNFKQFLSCSEWAIVLLYESSVYSVVGNVGFWRPLVLNSTDKVTRAVECAAEFLDCMCIIKVPGWV